MTSSRQQTPRWIRVFGGFVLLAGVVGCGAPAPGRMQATAATATSTAAAAPTEAPRRIEALGGATSRSDANQSTTPRRPLVALDPGHGADEVGAAANGVTEKHSNLDMAFRVARALEQRGVDVLLTRQTDERAAVGGSGQSATRIDLQARVKAVNAAGAAVFVSLHSNGSTNTSERGIEVYYDSRREFGDDNRRLAYLVLDGAVSGLTTFGDAPRNRGVLDAACWRSNNGRCVGLFVLSPGGLAAGGNQPSAAKEATAMPAVLVELLFISNTDDAALLRNDAARDAMAGGVAAGILRYLGI